MHVPMSDTAADVIGGTI
ncbi:BnaC06g26420D [Brassica napus]|uniref:BnaC06g26420D protein n=1 Tax=Brassica napus TaxID=3708 RepID=A0A078GUN6_BRANA|nr:BnaC06g26420D [Brassica napus]